MQEKEIPKSVFHFTSLDVFLELFKQLNSSQDYLEFHASSVNYMNDLLEYVAAENECSTKVEEIISNSWLGNAFAISFAEGKDSVPMWGLYGEGGRGACLEFNVSKLSSYFTSTDQSAISYYQFRPCTYLSDIKKPEAKPWDDSSQHSIPTDLLSRVVDMAFCKSTDFSYEKEWRITLWRKTWMATEDEGKSCFKIGKRGLCNYTIVRIPKDCLEHIYLGPCYNWQHLQDLNQALPQELDISRKFITKSEISLTL